MDFRKAIILLLTLFLLPAQSVNAAPLSREELPKLQAIALQGGDSPKLHAATEKGLYVSNDGGAHWQLSYPFRLPATLVTETPDGTLWAFVAGKGLLKMPEKSFLWAPVTNSLGIQVITSLSAAKGRPERLVALNQFGKLIRSEDGGRHWTKLAPTGKLNEAAQRGKALYQEKCQSCHGVEGVGESYSVQSLQDKGYIMAPPLDDSAHAWHHTDEALVKIILESTPRPSRMPAWGKQGLTEEDAKALVAYIKSLWSKRSLACQGPKHMQCM